ncbi:MAG TPA: hypothetical protein VK843_12615 [Planctomycetota bacterium]|nr:hypothetical protein [Planctomycetota bacterium]
MNSHSFLSKLVLAVALSFLAACSMLANPTGPVTSESGWVSTPVFDQGPAGRRIQVSCEDPAKSGLKEELSASFLQSLSSKGYSAASSESEADLLCVLVVRYFARTVPPEGHAELVAQSTDTIQGGDESWLAPDGSGYDTQTRKPRVFKFRSGARSRIGEVFRGHQDDEWTLLVDVAIGARVAGQRQVVQRHEGRVWAACNSTALDRKTASEVLLAEIEKRLPETLP